LKSEWEFYPCRVDDAPASIMVDLGLADYLPVLRESWLYVVQIPMLSADAHGMGSADETVSFRPLQDAIVESLVACGLRQIGRLRNHGLWQLSFMGPPQLESEVDRVVEDSLLAAPRRFATVAKSDPDWTYYSDFLFPNHERMRWIQDNRVVEALERRGDSLTKPRRVDHWIYFHDYGSCSAFASAVALDGFHVRTLTPDESRFGLEVNRVDSVRVDDIHEVTVLLSDLAIRHGGNYDGWGTSVVSDGAADHT